LIDKLNYKQAERIINHKNLLSQADWKPDLFNVNNQFISTIEIPYCSYAESWAQKWSIYVRKI